ncbi:putative ABC transport system ATP-binding protein/lipoprotein-releasing system ATP-binding protein [Prosthecobacter fusiformis]|uniref:Putative ABC transport system ATP-binding protein/lipoprotein-releasing system ATP-binding protein n=1 Tax=Prosthecobacter fusiformis TaxID=48464 RepID=A0A4R7RK31_9BACT|nr:ABC transporter ATP-binding protein [Prosthecobacter fusiformis]TDU63102.1 putative ABC transport system ATP-binding protein/lipoprotein-releasing system ATP-binding protein [Prosthecobacter fusiformis]
MSLISLSHISKSYREPGSGNVVPVLRDVSLTIQAGESVAIVGPSGCGKSTLLNILGTLDVPDEGDYVFDGTSIAGSSPVQLAALRSEKVGFIFQLHHLMPQCTVLENVLLPTLALKTKPDAATLQKRAESLLKSVGLQDRLNWKPAQLSGGERQRVAVVRALINQPKVILADEPTGALDEKNAESLTSLLLELQQTTGTTLVMVTHHPAQAARMGRTLKLHEGMLVG